MINNRRLRVSQELPQVRSSYLQPKFKASGIASGVRASHDVKKKKSLVNEPINEQEELNSEYLGPLPNHTIDMDKDLLMESNLVSITHLTNSQIVARLEQQRFDRLHKAGANLKCEILLGYDENTQEASNAPQQRCPKCTLPLPCQHFQTTEELFCFKKSGRIFKQKEWTLITTVNREALIRKKLKFERSRQLSADQPVDFGQGMFVESHMGDHLSVMQPRESKSAAGATRRKLNQGAFNTLQNGNTYDNSDMKDLFGGTDSISTGRMDLTQMTPSGSRCFNKQERLHQAQLIRKLRDDTFLRRLQLHTIKNQATSALNKGNPCHQQLTRKDRKLLERQVVEQKMEQVVNTDRFSDLAGLDENQLAEMLKQEKLQEDRTVSGNYQPWEGMTRTNRKEFIERLLIQHKRKQLDQVSHDQLALGSDMIDFTGSLGSTAGSITTTNILNRRNKRNNKMYTSSRF